MSKPTLYDNIIIDAIVTAFNTLKTTNSDYNVIAKNVYDSNAVQIAEADQPAYNISEDGEDFLDEDASSTIHTNVLRVNIDMLATSAYLLRQMKADAKKLIKAYNPVSATNKYLGLDCVYYIKYISTQRNIIDHLGRLVANRRLTIEVYYRQTAWSD